MNVTLWILQVVLALHTATGALWKFSHAEKTVDSLSAIPHGVWLTMSIIELSCVVCLVVPAFVKGLALLAPLAMAVIATEMLAFIAVHFATGHAANGQVVYWLVVAVFCASIAYGRLVLRPLGRPVEA